MMVPHRIERGSLGEVLIPASALAEVNRDLGLLDAEKAGAIIQASQEVIDGQ